MTNKRLIAKAGFIRLQTIELNIDRAESLFPYIARPMEFRQQFNDFIDNEIGGGSKNQIELKPPAV